MACTSNMQPPTFTGKNYELCSLTMKTLFRGHDLWEMVDNGYVEYNSLTQVEKDVLKDQRNNDGKTMFYIHQFMHEGILPRVASTNQAKEAWDILQTSYHGMGKVKTSKLLILRKYFETLSMKDTNSVDSFYTIKSHGKTIEDTKIVEKVLTSLPPKFGTVVVTLEERKDSSQFSLDELQVSLINHEHKLNRSNMSSKNAFFAQSFISAMEKFPLN
jgi:hypothetical protein